MNEESLLSRSVRGLSSSDLLGLPNSQQVSSSTIRFAGYLFKRSNKPHDGSLSHDADGAFPVVEEQVSVGNIHVKHDDMQSIGAGEEYGNNGKSGVVASERFQDEQLRHYHDREPLAMPFVPLLPDLNDPTTAQIHEQGNKEESNDTVQSAIELLSSFFGQSNNDSWIGTNRTRRQDAFSYADEKNLIKEIPEFRERPISTSYSKSGPDSTVSRKSSYIQQPPTVAMKTERDRTLPIAIADAKSSTSSYPYGQAASNLPLHLKTDQPRVSYKRNGSDSIQDDEKNPPESFIDPKDGHIWRAKYCVLVDGALYFYKNAKIANSIGAQQERDRLSFNSKSFDSEGTPDEIDHLGKSPMPRTLHPLLSAKEKSGGGSFCLDPNVYWEKRVALSMVGAVRSSPDFGERAFELIAMTSGDDSDGDGEVDRLILKASDSEDVNAWIFEIHKSFVVLMKHVAAVVGSNEACSKEPSILLSQSYNVAPAQMITRFRTTSNRSKILAPLSPQLPLAENRLSPSQPLSGSNTIYRRRRSLGENETQISSISMDLPSYEHYPSPRIRSNSFDLANPNVLGISSKPFPINKIPSSRSSVRLHDVDQTILDSTEANTSNFDTIIETVKGEVAEKYVPPHLRNKTPSTKYVPPHMRKDRQNAVLSSDMDRLSDEDNSKIEQKKGSAVVEELLEQIKSEEKEVDSLYDYAKEGDSESDESSSSEDTNETGYENSSMKLGGCADPCLVKDSICHEKFIPLGAPKVTADYHAYGYVGDYCEIGAVSKCGIREYNEDAYLILNDFLRTQPGDDVDPFDPSDSYFSRFAQRGLFAIFDGHCGNQAARYAAEKFHSILLEESLNVELDNDSEMKTILSQILMETVTRLDHEFCVFSKYGGRDWFAGSTAIIVLVLDKHVVVASVGDAGGVISASTNNVDRAVRRGWSVLQEEDFDLNKIGGSCKGIIYREMNESHCPSRPEEKERILAANGWVTHETEIPMIAQFHRMDWGDRDVLDIFQRCFSDRLDTAKPARILNIYRVCGDLAVSRAIGDREYKAAFNKDPKDQLAGNAWKSPAPMPYMTYKDIHNEEHTGLFEGDLVISTPEIKFFELGSLGTDELILLACDGLWDVIDPDDAVRVTRNLLFGVELGAKETAVRLAQLAKGLGSSDNITVIVIKFHR